MPSITTTIAAELGAQPWQVEAAIGLLDGGSTVPFVARYRKEATGTLDDVQLRTLAERLEYLRDLEKRREAILESVGEQGKLDAATRAAIMAADTKARLEDVYAPFKPKRRTKAQVAREAGLEPLKSSLLGRPDLDPRVQAAAFVDEAKGVPTVEAALEGARAIVVETLSEDANLVGKLRERFWKEGRASSKVKPGMEAAGAKFSDYFDSKDPFSKMPPHRVMAILRGEKEGFLDVQFEPDDTDDHLAYSNAVAAHAGFADKGRPGDRWLLDAARWAWRTRIEMNLSMDVRTRLAEAAEEGSIAVFAANLRDLLLAAPAGARPTMGLDPGIRTGVKVAVVDATGKVVATDTVYPFEPARRMDEAMTRIARLIAAHKVELVAIGNGTASRETERMVVTVAKAIPSYKFSTAVVSEAGASVYSASEIASKEFPDMDVSLRGAVSIARRLQDPLAELVKVEPKAIGVGQYQHDVSQTRLSRSLEAVVEDCVNKVGVDLNTASAPLLSRVSGLGESLAHAIVAHRDAAGPFRSRAALLDVSRLGPKAFEQAAGFLRVRDGVEPLDRTAVHPESYPLARRILSTVDADVHVALGRASDIRRKAKPEAFVKEGFGLITVKDVIDELERPGRDPRPSFKTATFAEGVDNLSDLKPGMVLEGTVTNVAAFGAFVDLGVHHDGLVHVSCMSTQRVKDPRDVARTGQVVTVKVLSVDLARKKVSLTMRLSDPLPEPGAERGAPPRQRDFTAGPAKPSAPSALGGAFGDAMRRAAEKGGRR